jgi:hypothetical protein
VLGAGLLTGIYSREQPEGIAGGETILAGAPRTFI